MQERVLIPAHYQPALPLDRLILHDPPKEDAISVDVLFVGGGPAGLAGAIQLKKRAMQSGDKRLVGIEIGVLEKANQIGDHCLSGAIINPQSLFELFPDLPLNDFPFYSAVKEDNLYLLTRQEQMRIPSPRVMRNRGYFIASLCEVVRWLGDKATKMGIHIFTGFPAESLLLSDQQVIGVRTTPAGFNRQGLPGSAYLPSSDIVAKVTVLSEGVRGTLTQAYIKWNKISSSNPQIYALGVKELWETPRVPDGVVHTVGWPVPKDCFGGGWIYPMGKNAVSFGLVVGLDYHRSTLDVHGLVQEFKEHPLLNSYLQGGRILEWGAKVIPEGGFYSIPERMHGGGLILIGDAAGFVNVASLKGIHYAIRSGIIAAECISKALLSGDFSAAALREYDHLIHRSEIIRDLYRTRNMRLAFKSGFYRGGIKAELMALTRGKFPGKKIQILADAQEPKVIAPKVFVKDHLGFGLKKEDAVFYSGNRTRDDIPQHLIVGKDLTSEVADFYTHMCPAGVYETVGDELRVNAPNCIDCKATDVLGPRWMPREGGSGPRYRRM